MTDILSEETVSVYFLEYPFAEIPSTESINVPFGEEAFQFVHPPAMGSSTLVINTGTAGGAYNGVSKYNRFDLLPSGASVWAFSQFDDHIGISPGPQANDLTALTFEVMFYLSGVGVDNTNSLWSKAQEKYETRGFLLYIDDLDMSIVLTRDTLDGYEEWRTAADAVEYGEWYILQLSWQCGLMPAETPSLYLNNLVVPMTKTVRAEQLWVNDRDYAAVVGNMTDLRHALNGKLGFFKLHREALSRGQCKTNYLAECWRVHNPNAGAMSVPSSAVNTTDDPVVRIGKNATSLNVTYDFSKIVTKLYPRGGGSSPSELTFDTPPYHPGAPADVKLVSPYVLGEWVCFDLPGRYTSYYGYTKQGDDLPSGMTVSWDTVNIFTGPTDFSGHEAWIPVAGGQQCAFQEFIRTEGFRPCTIKLLLYRDEHNNYDAGESAPKGQWPRVRASLYTTKYMRESNFSGYPYYVPMFGPLVECVRDVRSIPIGQEHASWIDFPVPGALYYAGHYAIVLEAFPNDALWPNDRIWWFSWGVAAGTPQAEPWLLTSGWSSKGTHPDAWSEVGTPGSKGSPFACMLDAYKGDATPQFKQAGPRTIAIRTSDYDPAKSYYLYYRQNSYLYAAEAAAQYGSIEGTYKDDSILTGDALVKAGSEYLDTISQPVLSWEVSAIDLYDMSPTTEWDDKFRLGQKVKVLDDKLNIEQDCYITRIEKSDLNQPHLIDIQLDNTILNAQKLLSNLKTAALTQPKYLQGATVSYPYTASRQADSTHPATLYFEVGNSAFIPSVTLTFTASNFQIPGSGGITEVIGSGKYRITIDGNTIQED